jgi:hypothetical protein
MSYTLDLSFSPAVPRPRMFEHFAARKFYKELARDLVAYEHPDTGVCFLVKLRRGRNALLQQTVVAAEFEIAWGRPRYFGVEAETELSAFVATFRPRIFDSQMHGMGEGPYSGEGFLKGWNFGNVFSIGGALPRLAEFGVETMPADVVRAVWAWNYRRPERSETYERSAYVPGIGFVSIDGRLGRAAVWPHGRPVVLPKVEIVLIGRLVGGERRYGAARWPEVLDVVRRAGFDVTQDPLDIRFLVPPAPIVEWADKMHMVDENALGKIMLHKVLEDDLVAAARESRETWRTSTNPA